MTFDQAAARSRCERGLATDVELAAQHDVSRHAPRLVGGAFVADAPAG